MATKCDCICVPRDEYEAMKAKKAVKKTASKPKRATTKPKTSKPRQRAVQTPRIAEPKVIMIEEPKVTATKTAPKTKPKAKTKSKAKAAVKTKTKPKAKMNTVYEVDYPQALPAPKRDVPYNGKVIERRVKTPKIEAPRQNVSVVKIEAPKQEKVKKDRQLAKRALAGAVIVGASTKQAAKVLNEARKERKAQKALARRNPTTVYEVDYRQALPAPKAKIDFEPSPPKDEVLSALQGREVLQLQAPKETTVRQLENCEGKGYFAKKACMARNRKLARDY